MLLHYSRISQNFSILPISLQIITYEKKLELNAPIGGIPDQTAKNYICKPPRYTTLVWRETEGDGDGDITRLVPKDADTSDTGLNHTPPLDLGGAVWGGPSDTHKAVRQTLISTFLENYWGI